MRRIPFALLALTLASISILGISSANAEIAVKRLTPQLEISNEIRAVAASGEKIALAGTSLTLIDRSARDLASAITVSATMTTSTARLFTDLIAFEGRFFAIGVAESLTATTTTAPSNLINPDSVTVGGSTPESRGLSRLVLLEFTAAGEVTKESVFEAPRPLLPHSLKVIGDQLAVVGSIASQRGVQGFLATSDIAGNWRSFELFGESATEIKDLANLRTLYGTSGETLVGSNRRGVNDGVIFFLNESGRLTRVVRSFLASSDRAWEGVSNAHLAVGTVKRGGNEEVAITKFSSRGEPQWFVRYPGSDPRLDLRTVALIASKKLTGISTVSPKGKNAIFIEFDAKGLSKRSTIKSVAAIPARNLIDLRDGYAIISDRQGRSQLIPLAP